MNLELSLLTKFCLVMTLAVLLPRGMERIGLPGVLGFIAAGVIVGPSGLAILDDKHGAMPLFSELGKLLFMFFVGFEVNLADFDKARTRSLAFGALTFLLPFMGGLVLSRVGGHSWNASVLVGSLIGSHTLLSFPALQKLGLTEHRAVLMAVGGTILTDVVSMLLLAVTVSVHTTGFSSGFLLRELAELAVFVPAVLLGLGALARKAIIRFGRSADLRSMILLVFVALAAEGARQIDLEGIVGAFLIGIGSKRALRGRFAVAELEVVARTLFVPAFFVATGFLIDFRLLGTTLTQQPLSAIGLVAALVLGKYAAARIATLWFGGSDTETRLVWSLTLPQMAATLAAAAVGYDTVNAAGERLLEGGIVNMVLALVVVTCIVGPILAERSARALATTAAVTSR